MVGRAHILLVSGDPETRRMLSEALRPSGAKLTSASSVAEARRLLAREKPALVFCERRLADGSFHDVLRAQEVRQTGLPVIVASRLAETEEYLEAMRMGAFDFIAQPYRRGEVEQIVQNALHRGLVAA